MRLAATLVLCSALFACTAVEEEEQPTEGQLLLGTAATLDGYGFALIEEGSDVELAAGAQGGFHVWLNVRVTGASGKVYLEREARRVSDGALILRALRQVIEVPDEAQDDWWESPAARPAFMCPSPIGIQVFDVEVAFDVRLTDEDGLILAEDQIILVPRCPAGDMNDFCLQICSG